MSTAAVLVLGLATFGQISGDQGAVIAALRQAAEGLQRSGIVVRVSDRSSEWDHCAQRPASVPRWRPAVLDALRTAGFTVRDGCARLAPGEAQMTIAASERIDRTHYRVRLIVDAAPTDRPGYRYVPTYEVKRVDGAWVPRLIGLITAH
jgi:hypothetical protein